MTVIAKVFARKLYKVVSALQSKRDRKLRQQDFKGGSRAHAKHAHHLFPVLRQTHERVVHRRRGAAWTRGTAATAQGSSGSRHTDSIERNLVQYASGWSPGRRDVRP